MRCLSRCLREYHHCTRQQAVSPYVWSHKLSVLSLCSTAPTDEIHNDLSLDPIILMNEICLFLLVTDISCCQGRCMATYVEGWGGGGGGSYSLSLSLACGPASLSCLHRFSCLLVSHLFVLHAFLDIYSQHALSFRQVHFCIHAYWTAEP